MTLGVGFEEWERMWREMEITQSLTLPLEEEEIEELPVKDERSGDNQEEVDLINSSEEGCGN